MQRFKWKIYTAFIVVFLFVIVMIPTIVVNVSGSKVTQADDFSEDEVIEQDEEASFYVKVQRENSGDIEEIPLETYVTSVVASEMPAEFEVEALKAQAVAARTYVVHQLLQNDGDMVMTDTTAHQVYKNAAELKQHFGSEYEENMKKIEQAVKETVGQIITYENDPITPTFFSMSNGYTEAAKNYWGNDLPYLQVVESKWEEDLPNFTEQKVFTIQEFNDALGMNVSNKNPAEMTLTRTESNRVEEMIINEQSINGREVREKLQLRSNDFTVEQKGDHFVFTTKGYGHGVGMSQYGANFMAEEGKDYTEILTYYYKGTDIEPLKNSAPTLVSN